MVVYWWLVEGWLYYPVYAFRFEDFWKPQKSVTSGAYHLVIWHSHGESTINGGLNGKIIYKWAKVGEFTGFTQHGLLEDTRFIDIVHRISDGEPYETSGIFNCHVWLAEGIPSGNMDTDGEWTYHWTEFWGSNPFPHEILWLLQQNPGGHPLDLLICGSLAGI